MTFLRPPFKIHGGKRYLYSWIIENFPKDYETMDYIEPFVGAGSVLLNKVPCLPTKIEAINDIDPGVIQIFRAVKEECDEFVRILKKIKYSERTFKAALKKKEFPNYMEHAVNEFILRRMSRGGLKRAFGWSERERGGKPGDLNAWETILGILPAISERIRNVHLINRRARVVIDAMNDANALCYCDPPYAPETRTSPNTYEYEMTVEQHEELAESLMRFKGKVIISGYQCPLYNRLYKGWRCVKKTVPNHSSQQKQKDMRTEAIWMNW